MCVVAKPTKNRDRRLPSVRIYDLKTLVVAVNEITYCTRTSRTNWSTSRVRPSRQKSNTRYAHRAKSARGLSLQTKRFTILFWTKMYRVSTRTGPVMVQWRAAGLEFGAGLRGSDQPSTFFLRPSRSNHGDLNVSHWFIVLFCVVVHCVRIVCVYLTTLNCSGVPKGVWGSEPPSRPELLAPLATPPAYMRQYFFTSHLVRILRKHFPSNVAGYATVKL